MMIGRLVGMIDSMGGIPRVRFVGDLVLRKSI